MDFRAGQKIDYRLFSGEIRRGGIIVKVFGGADEPLLKCRTIEGFMHFISPRSILKVYKEEFDPAGLNPNETFKMSK